MLMNGKSYLIPLLKLGIELSDLHLWFLNVMGQIVQTQIRLLIKEEQSDLVFTVSSYVCIF